MMHKAWSSIEEVPYYFSRSSVKCQGHTAPKIVKFDPNWAFPDCNTSLNSPMAMKCCTKLETAKERCAFVFQDHPSHFKVTRYKTSPILTQIGRFRTIGRSQLSNPSDLPCFVLHVQAEPSQNWLVVLWRIATEHITNIMKYSLPSMVFSIILECQVICILDKRSLITLFGPLSAIFILNILRSEQNGYHSADDIMKCIFSNANHCMYIRNLPLRIQQMICQYWSR